MFLVANFVVVFRQHCPCVCYVFVLRVSKKNLCVRSLGNIVGASPLCVGSFGNTVGASLHAA